MIGRGKRVVIGFIIPRSVVVTFHRLFHAYINNYYTYIYAQRTFARLLPDHAYALYISSDV